MSNKEIYVVDYLELKVYNCNRCREMSIFKKVLFFVVLMLFNFVKVDALSVDNNNITIKEGEDSSISLYANIGEEVQVTSVSFSLVYTTYDVPAHFNVNSMYTDNINGSTHEIVFDSPVSGTVNLGTININVVKSAKDTAGFVNINSGKATTSDGEVINLNYQSVTVTIEDVKVEEPVVNNTTSDDNKEETSNDNKEETRDNKEEEIVEEDNNLLDKIDSDIVNIKIKKDVFEYNIKISDDVEELDLKPVVKDDSYKVEVSNQKISELVDNKITITVSKDDKSVVYTINVDKKTDIEIDDSKGTTYSYKGKWVSVIVVLSIVLVLGLLIIRKKK